MAPSATQEDQSSLFFVDGKRLAFVRRTFMPAATDVYLIDSDGSGLTLLLSGSGIIQSVDDISPDGKRLLLSRDSDPGAGVNLDVFAINVDGSGLVNLTPGIPDIDQAPSFSPDGKRIAFNRRGNFQPPTS
jgi:Tol biopolymer transport system component